MTQKSKRMLYVLREIQILSIKEVYVGNVCVETVVLGLSSDMDQWTNPDTHCPLFCFYLSSGRVVTGSRLPHLTGKGDSRKTIPQEVSGSSKW